MAMKTAGAEDWAERCLRQCRAEAVYSLRALLQEHESEAPTGSAANNRTPPPEIIITPADLDEDAPESEPVSVPTPSSGAMTGAGSVTLSPKPKHRGHSLRRLLTRSKKSRHAEKKAAAESSRGVATLAAGHPESSDGRGAAGRAAARAAAAAARRTAQSAEDVMPSRFMSMRSPQQTEPDPDDLAGRLRAYTESGPGRPSAATTAAAAAARRRSATSLSADFQRYLAARVAELRERRRHGLTDDQVRDEFLREVGSMLREMADQIREARLQQQLQEQCSQPALPTRLVVSAAHQIGRGFQAAGGAVRHALRFLTRAGHHEQAC